MIKITAASKISIPSYAQKKKSKLKEKDQNYKPENKRLANTKIENPEEDPQKEIKFKKKITDTVKREAKYQGPSLFDIEFDKIEAKKATNKRENLVIELD